MSSSVVVEKRMTSSWWNARKIFFYVNVQPEEEEDTMLFFLKPPPPSSSTTDTHWSMSFSSLHDLVNTVLKLDDSIPIDQSVPIVSSFLAYLEVQVACLDTFVYGHYPSLALFYDDAYPIQLPAPSIQPDSVYPWSSYYRMSNSFSLCELLTYYPTDFAHGWTIPPAVSHFAIEYVVGWEPRCVQRLDLQPAIRVCHIALTDTQIIEEGWVLCTVEFAKEHLGPWLPGNKQIEIKMKNWKTFRQQIEWDLPNNHRVFLLL
jgi:hypothetical protein